MGIHSSRNLVDPRRKAKEQTQTISETWQNSTLRRPTLSGTPWAALIMEHGGNWFGLSLWRLARAIDTREWRTTEVYWGTEGAERLTIQASSCHNSIIDGHPLQRSGNYDTQVPCMRISLQTAGGPTVHSLTSIFWVLSSAPTPLSFECYFHLLYDLHFWNPIHSPSLTWTIQSFWSGNQIYSFGRQICKYLWWSLTAQTLLWTLIIYQTEMKYACGGLVMEMAIQACLPRERILRRPVTQHPQRL